MASEPDAPPTRPPEATIRAMFYDSAPSGRYGTMTYLSRAIVNRFRHSLQGCDCFVS